MSQYQDDMYKSNVYNDCDYSILEGVPLIQGDSDNVLNRTNQSQYPGNRRTTMCNVAAPVGSVLVRTAGNALQAVPSSVMDSASIQFVEVHVPPNALPGDTLHVRSPYGRHDELIAAIIPAGLFSGQSFFVQLPPSVRDEEAAVTDSPQMSLHSEASNSIAPTNNSIVVVGEDVSPSEINHDLHLYPATDCETDHRGEMV